MSVEIVLTIGVIILVIYGVLIQESDIDITVKRSKTLEGRLKRELNAKGDGLGKLTESVKEKLPQDYAWGDGEIFTNFYIEHVVKNG